VSWGFFNHNIALRLECTNEVPRLSEDTLIEFWQSARTTTNGSSARQPATTSLNAYGTWLNVKDDVVFISDVTETTYNTYETIRSTDYGVNYDVLTQPFDNIWNEYDPVNYPTYYGRSRLKNLFLFGGGSLGAFAGWTAGSGGQTYSLFTSNDLGDTWELVNSGVADATSLQTLTDSVGKFNKVNGYGFGSGVKVGTSTQLMGGRFADCYVGYQTFPPPGHNTKPSSNLVNPHGKCVATNSGANSPPGNCYSIVQLSNGWVYQTDGEGGVYATNDNEMSTRRRVNTIYNNGTPTDWRATYTGAWRATGQGNGNWSVNYDEYMNAAEFPLLTNNYHWMAKGNNLLLPTDAAFTAGSATDFARYYSIYDNSFAELIDYNSLITKGDANDSNTKFSAKLFYVEACNRWVLVYAYRRVLGSLGGNGDLPRWFYMRVGGLGFRPEDFGPPQKLYFPAGWELKGNENGAIALAYSKKNREWLFGTYMEYTPGTNIWMNKVWHVADSFYCPIP